MKPRPPGVNKRELLVGILTVTAVKLGLPLDTAAQACEALFEDYAPDMRRWYPVLDPAHARAAIAYAGRALRVGGVLTQEEYEWVCQKARLAILKGGPEPGKDFALADFPGRLGAARQPESPDAA